MEEQEKKDADTLLGFGLIFENQINELYHSLKRTLAKDNRIAKSLTKKEIDCYLQTNRYDKIEAYIKLNNQCEALARQFKRVGDYYEEQCQDINKNVIEIFEKYKKENPDYEQQEKQYTQKELQRMYEFEEKFIDKPSPQVYQDYVANGIQYIVQES